MKVCKDVWESFLDDNNWDLHPICRNPMTGEWPAPGDQLFDLTNFSIAKSTPPSVVRRQTELIELPDEWFLPVTRKDLPPKPNQKIDSYLLSEEGFIANRERLEKGYRYKKHNFEEFADSIISNARHYKKTLARRSTKQTGITIIANDGSYDRDKVCIVTAQGLHWGLTVEQVASLHEQLELVLKKHAKNKKTLEA